MNKPGELNTTTKSFLDAGYALMEVKPDGDVWLDPFSKMIKVPRTQKETHLDNLCMD